MVMKEMFQQQSNNQNQGQGLIPQIGKCKCLSFLFYIQPKIGGGGGGGGHWPSVKYIIFLIFPFPN